ncbi:MAG: ParB/RepB/Spo0J family partition protein [Rhizomicrobium sp.]
MELRHIPLEQLHISSLNMRHEKKAPDVSDILPSIRARGILQPLLVRPNREGFEIVAGRRRYFSAKAVEKERGSFDDIPCAVMQQGDDAAALEASLIENAARLDPTPMKQFETFYRLVKEGRTPEQIAITFGLTRRQVEQRLALANLHPKIRELYGDSEVGDETVEYLTMATKAQQKEWLEAHEDGVAFYGRDFKHVLLGEEAIDTGAALFPIGDYKGGIKTDLFGEDSYFSDAKTFWELQRAAIEQRRQAYLESGWQEVIVLPDGDHFQQWEHERLPKTRGGKVFVTVSKYGRVEFFEGWISRAHLERAKKQEAKAKADKPDPANRPQMTQAMENYLELHRHAAVRLALLVDPAKAFRLLVAHAIASSGNWSVRLEAQRSHSNAIKGSIESSAAQQQFEKERRKAYDLLDLPETVTGDERTALCFVKLLGMKDAQVMRLASVIMADTLAVGSFPVETAGAVLEVDARPHWQADDCFLDMIRDKATLSAMIAEVAGKDVAKANAGGKAATLRQIIRDALAGRNGRKKAEGWLPGWMAFPFAAYGKGSSGLAEASATAKKLLRKL